MFTMSIVENCNETGKIHFDSRRLKRVTPLNPAVIDINSHFAGERARVEAFIQDIYQKNYQADITVSYPIVISARDENGDVLAAAGFRLATSEPLFLEQYTKAPIEARLSAQYKETIGRHEIAEIGNLASAGSGASIFLFAALSSYLDAHGIRFATITSTNNLSYRIRKLGLNPQFICDADPALLSPTERARWGRYYDTNPQVFCGSVKDGVGHLHRALGTVYESVPATLYTRLHYRPS